jgi:hypothetical protein
MKNSKFLCVKNFCNCDVFMSLLKIFKYLTKDVSMSSVLPFQKKNGTKTNNMVPEKKNITPSDNITYH